MTVAVGFSPRVETGEIMRRGATPERRQPHRFNRRSATKNFTDTHRGLKPTATFTPSLRDSSSARQQLRMNP